MTNITPVTRTTETEKRYQERIDGLLLRYGKDWREDPPAFCRWLINEAVRCKWSKSTWRQYRSAAIFFMEENGPKEAFDLLINTRTTLVGVKPEIQRTSSQKMKRVSEADLDKIALHINSKSKTDTLLLVWLRATILAGLRPAEWRHAQIKDDILTTKNAKSTNGRAFAESRKLDVRELREIDKRVIAKLIDSLSDLSDHEFDLIYKNVRQRLWRLNQKLWPRRSRSITLYSGRHQFKANCTSAGYTKNEIAAMMGHASNETASSHYGRGVSGSGSQPVKPAPEDTAIVTELNAHRVPKGYTPSKSEGQGAI